MEKIYHYTSMQSFEAIINYQCIRMTRSDFMNDPHDCQVFFDIVEKYITDEKVTMIMDKSNLGDKAIQEIIKEYPVLDYMKYIYEQIPIYVFSLTSESDTLLMWNYYSGGGLRLAFDRDKLFDEISRILCTKEFELAVMTDVEYISSTTDLHEIKLNSFLDFKVKEYFKNTNSIEKREPSMLHNNGQNLEFFIDSFIKSYLVTVKHLIKGKSGSEKSLKDNYLPRINNDFFKEVFNHNKIQKNLGYEFKTDIDIYMLILAAHYKPKTFEDENETRIVFFDYNLEDNGKENYYLYTNGFGTCLKPYINCQFSNNSCQKKLSSLIEDIILSPSTTIMPFQLDVYKKVIRNFMKKNGGNIDEKKISASEHDVRW